MRTEKIKVVHITAHLGGGVGRIISSLVKFRAVNKLDIITTVISLEATNKKHLCDIVTDAGTTFIINPSLDQLQILLARADIIQVEWWHHPVMAGWLVANSSRLYGRLIVWSHISGRFYPYISPEWVSFPQAFIFTAPVEHAPDISNSNIVETAYSSAGFSDIPRRKQMLQNRDLVCTYVGTINPAKLHPEIIEYIAAVKWRKFKLHLYGDRPLNFPLEDMAKKAGMSERVMLHGYTQKPYDVLSSTDVFIYLLNPNHYGTTENVLLEAMAHGAVPIVLDNFVEKHIVKHLFTGVVVRSPSDFNDAIQYLLDHPAERLRMSENARIDVTSRFSLAHTSNQLMAIYDRVMHLPKRRYEFKDVFGETPSDWFKFGLGRLANLFPEPPFATGQEMRRKHPIFYEETKSSVFHYLKYYPADKYLQYWAKLLCDDVERTKSSKCIQHNPVIVLNE